jgi:hypothetical protein
VYFIYKLYYTLSGFRQPNLLKFLREKRKKKRKSQVPKRKKGFVCNAIGNYGHSSCIQSGGYEGEDGCIVLYVIAWGANGFAIGVPPELNVGGPPNACTYEGFREDFTWQPQQQYILSGGSATQYSVNCYSTV